MKKSHYICLLIFFLSIKTFAFTPEKAIDKTGSITGKVLDAKLQQPLPYVNVIVKKTSGETLTGGITNEDGTFEILKIAEGNFIVNIQYIGYKTISKEIAIGKGSYKINLGNILLEEAAEGLDEVTVIAETSSVVQKIDRKVINVGKDLTSAGTTASELLNNIQSVSVDSQTGNLSLRGNENVRVLIDGKPSNVSVSQLLKQIPSSSIKQIELITNPSAKYNPEGMSGIINIILHKNANQGFNGNIDTGITQGINTRFNGSVGMNYKTGKLNFYTNYGSNSGKSDNNGFVERDGNNSLQDFKFQNDTESHLAKFGIDFFADDNNTFSIYTIQNYFDSEGMGNVKIQDDNTLTTDNTNISINDNYEQTYNFNYRLDFDKEGHKIDFESNYSKLKGTENAISEEYIDPSDPFLNYTNDINNISNNTLINLDYTNPLSEKSKLELGLEYRLNKTENDSDSSQHEFVLDGSGNQIPDGNGGFETQDTPNISFTYNRNIYSAYANYNHEFKTISIQLGARFEQYEIEGDFYKGSDKLSVDDAIFSVYPSAFITYNPTEKNQFQISYSRRVDRPSLGQINPIRQWATPRVTSVGNPNLNPQFTNSFEFNYTRQLKKGSLSFGTFYRRVNGTINRIVNKDPFDEDKVLLTFSNYNNTNRYGFEVAANYKITKWWSTNASTDLYLQKQSGIANGEQLEVTNNAFNARINNNFTATKNLRFQLFYMFTGGGRSIQFDVSSMSMLNAGASLNILKSKGSISFRVNDIFKGMRFKFDAKTPYPSNGQFNWESRTAYIGFSYRFGGEKNQALKRKSRDNNETKDSGGFL
ncbi:outer membrane beta-barrel family protein [Snuella sedimenti]|uniref:TonB-dependent receptor n=1 Tax=Snuella sedimenti TaxID=2798802 RepID=A0A8J7IHC2_9FLAO|nr:outer membrane beta-barrel family protein [Snuella sedimenti]MBJ6367846.1 TonB-dependent receptor [Snuella sedimenti]